MKKEKLSNEIMDEADVVDRERAADNDNIAEPTVIRLEANDSERVSQYSDDDEGNEKKSTLRKRPSDDTLLKLSTISFVLGILSCTIFLGNVPLAVIGILLGLTAAANKYKTAYTKAGLICSFIGCILGIFLGLAFVVLVIALIVALVLIALAAVSAISALIVAWL
jgi:hypothetical protein